jgi:TANFOR domain-containing protein
MMIKKLSITILFILLALGTSAQENSVLVIVNVIPPYSHKVNDYIDNNRILVTLQYNSFSADLPEIDVYLQGEVSNDGGDRIYTNKNQKPAQPITLTYGVPVTITPGDLEDIFDFNYVETEGINKQNLYSGAGLPEGTYTICVRAYNYDTNQPVSAEEPSGCSAPFEILNLEAPEFIQPECGEILTNISPDEIIKGKFPSDITTKQNSKEIISQGKLFSWIIPAGAPVDIEYELEIKKVPVYLEADPADIMNSSQFFVEYTEITNATAAFVDYSNYEFEPGFTYIFTVTASDPYGNLVFQNNGKSEVCWFTVEEYDELPDFEPGLGIFVNPELEEFLNQFELIPNTVISGTLLTKLHSEANLSSVGGESTYVPTGNEEPGNTGNTEGANYNNMMDVTLQTGGNANFNSLSVNSFNTSASYIDMLTAQQNPPHNTGYINGSTVDIGGAEPLRNTTISLIARFSRKTGGEFYKPQSLSASMNSPHNIYVDVAGNQVGHNTAVNIVDHVLKVTTTDAQGNFTFDFSSDFFTGAFYEDLGSDEELKEAINTNAWSGIISLRIEVQNQKFCSPDIDIFAKRGDAIQLPAQVALIKDYDLKLKVVSAFDKDFSETSFPYDIFPKSIPGGEPIPGAIVKVMRDIQKLGNEHPAILLSEGQQLGTTSENQHGEFKDVFIGATDDEGYVHIPHMVMHWFVTDGNKQTPYIYSAATRSENPDATYEETLYNFEPFFGGIEKMFSSSNDGFAELDAATWQGTGTVFNHDYHPPDAYERSIPLTAAPPEIKGRIMAESNLENIGLKDIKINLYEQDKLEIETFPGFFLSEEDPDLTKVNRYTERSITYTNASGIFRFPGLSVNANNGSAIGPYRRFQVNSPIYKRTTRTPFNYLPLNLKYGELYFQEIQLEARQTLKGKVQDELGNPVKSYLRLLPANPYVKTETKGGSVSSYFSEEQFEIPTYPGGGLIEVLPLSGQYFADTLLILPANYDDRVTITVHRKMHRLKLQVGNKVTGKPIANADVIVGDSLVWGKTNIQGTVELLFPSPGEQFLLKISASNFTPTQVAYNIPVSNKWQNETLELEPAMEIKGIITEKASGNPIQNALVYIRLQSTDNHAVYLESYTNAEGKYTLSGIPIELTSADIHVVKDGSNPSYIGVSKAISLSAFAYPPVSYDFQLTVVSNWDLSNIWGFPVSIEQFTSKDGINARISGFFHSMPHINGFSTLNDNEKLYFKNLNVKKTGSKITPISPAIETESFSLPLKIAGGFEGKFHIPSFFINRLHLKLEKNGELGKMSGALKLDLAAFRFAYDFYGDFYLGTDTLKSDITVFRSVPQNSIGLFLNRFYVFDLDNNNKPVPISGFRVFGFNASSAFSESYLSNSAIKIGATLHTNIEMANGAEPLDLKIKAGIIEITKENIEVKPNANNLISFELEKWKVESKTGWEFDKVKDAIVIPEAIIFTGLGIDAPIKGLNIRPNALREGEIDFTKGLSIGNIVALKLSDDIKPKFNFDAGVGHYRISVVGNTNGPAAWTEGNLAACNKPLEFNSIGMLSDNSTVLNIGNEMTFHNVMPVYVDQIMSGSGYFILSGMPNMGIPGMIPTLANIKYTKENNILIAELQPLSSVVDCNANIVFKPEQVKGRQTLSNGLYTAYGTFDVKSPPGVSGAALQIKGQLIKTPNSCRIEVIPEQEIAFGRETMKAIEGQISVTNNSWGELVFDCNTNSTGLSDENVITYTIHGGIEADSKGISVDEINTPLGSLSMAYLFPEKALVGDLTITANLNLGFAKLMGGQMKMRFDPHGFYMGFAGGLELSSQQFEGGFILGSYDENLNAFAKPMLSRFETSAPSFAQGLKGFYAIGQRNFINVSVPLAVLNVGLKAGIGAYIKLDFAENPEFTVGGYGFLKGYSGIKLPLCYLSVEALNYSVVEGSYKNNMLSLSTCGTNQLCVNACGYDACVGILYYTKTTSSGSFTYDISIGGNCSDILNNE